MHMLVTPMRQRGVALAPQARQRYQAVRGNVLMHSEKNKELGRTTNTAEVDVGMPMESNPLPPLLDVTLAWMAHTGFVLSGIEYIDGCAYAQSWWCRME